MNVFSTLENPKYPIALTAESYHRATSRSGPYVANDGKGTHYYALCPECGNPVTLVNKIIPTTQAEILYAKHRGSSVKGLAEHNQEAYEDCPLHNPERFDSKTLRKNITKNEEILSALKNHIHLVIYTLEKSMGIKLTDKIISEMLSDFKSSQGHRYRSITLYNLPFGFAYMTEGRDLWNIKIANSDLKKAINQKSKGFKLNEQSKVTRKPDVNGTQLCFYFNNHRLGDEYYISDRVDFVVAEISSSSDASKILYTKTVSYDSALFVNTYFRRERLRLLALKHL